MSGIKHPLRQPRSEKGLSGNNSGLPDKAGLSAHCCHASSSVDKVNRSCYEFCFLIRRMELKGGYGFLLALSVFLAAELAFAQPGGLPPASRHGLTRFAEEDVIDAGVGGVHAISGDDQQVGEDLVDVVEADQQTTVVGGIELGELLCDSLEDAPDSSLLRFTISSNETVIAERSFYSSIDGIVLPDGNTRKTWLGDVIDPEPADDSIPRTVSMTWTNPCDPETFLLKLVSRNSDGSTSIVTSIPCEAGSSNEICMMELEVFFNNVSETEPVAPPENSSPVVVESSIDSGREQEARMLKERRVSKTKRRIGSLDAQGTRSGRSLQDTTVIDVMMLYTPEAASERGITDAQLLTRIVEGMVTVNQAITNSEIADLEFRLVHVEELPYDQMDYDPDGIEPDTEPELKVMASNTAVADLRNDYQADLVQLVGYFPGTCGLAYAFNGNDNSGYSLVDSNCFDDFSHTHEIGHNMGCYHDRDNSEPDTDYSHAWRHCTGTVTYRTIMSYPNNGCAGVPPVNYFSNPDVSLKGMVTGTATADNARTIEDNMEAVAAFRTNDVVCVDDGEACTATTDCCTGFCGSAGLCATEACGNAGGNALNVGNSVCEPENNNAECEYDGGDCCECDCLGQECSVTVDCTTPEWNCQQSDAVEVGFYSWTSFAPEEDYCEGNPPGDAGFGDCDYFGLDGPREGCFCMCRESDDATSGCGSGEYFNCIDPDSECVEPTTVCTDDTDCILPQVCCSADQVCEVPDFTNPTACGDPHMTGFHGQKFDFTGDDGQWYCLISDVPSMYLNMRVTAPVSSRPDITYITGLSLITTDGDGQDHSVVISVKDPHSLVSDCPAGVSPCLADGALSVVLDGNETLMAPGAVELAPDVQVSAVNLPGACRSFGFEKYWERKKLEYAQAGRRRLAAVQSMGEWILGDPTATNMAECTEYVARQVTGGGDGDLFAHQSEHASFQIVTPTATIRLSHGRLHQIAQFGLPDHLTWQMNLAVDHNDVSLSAKGVLGETMVPTRDAGGEYIMHGMEAIRGAEEDYHVEGPLGVDFVLG